MNLKINRGKKKDFEAIRQENNSPVKSDNRYIHKELHYTHKSFYHSSKIFNSFKLIYCLWWKIFSHLIECTFNTQILSSVQNAGFFKVIKLDTFLHQSIRHHANSYAKMLLLDVSFPANQIVIVRFCSKLPSIAQDPNKLTCT